MKKCLLLAGLAHAALGMRLDGAAEQVAKSTNTQRPPAVSTTRARVAVATTRTTRTTRTTKAATTATTATTTTTTTTTTTKPRHVTPHEAFADLRCGRRPPVLTTANMSLKLYDEVAALVTSQVRSLDTKCDERSCPQGAFAGCVLRLAGHDFMDFQDGTGGSDGCIDFGDPDNAGLAPCLYEGLPNAFGANVTLKRAYAPFCDRVSIADFLVIAAEAVMSYTRTVHVAATPKAPGVDFRSRFKFGRTTVASCPFAKGRLPSAEGGCEPVERSFVKNLGLTWNESAALMGVHTLGRVHLETSGFDGWWTEPSGARLFNNDYYGQLLTKGWWPFEASKGGKVGKAQWERVDLGFKFPRTPEGEVATKQIMLSTDLCLAFDRADARAKPTCCAWQSFEPFRGAVAAGGGDFCGVGSGHANNSLVGRKAQNEACCTFFSEPTFETCGNPSSPTGKAIAAVKAFAESEAVWLAEFHVAWAKATERGAKNLKRPSP